MNYCGIDVANKSSSICIINENSHTLLETEVATESGDIGQVMSGFGPLKVIIEASPLSETIATFVEAYGHQAVIIDARAAKKLMGAMKKTDRRDAKTLAEIGRCGWYTEVHRKSAESRELRSLLRARQSLLKSNKAIKSSIRGILRAHGIKVGDVSEGQFAQRIVELTNTLPLNLVDALTGMLEALDKAAKEAKRIKKALEMRCQQDEVSQRLESVPGVGPLISTAYRSTIDTPERFKHSEEVADYLGLAPRIYQSGEVEYRGRITKEGDRLLRSLLVEGAHVLLTRGQDCALKRWGLSLAKRVGNAKAKVAVARKLAILLWRLWKDNKVFEAFPTVA